MQNMSGGKTALGLDANVGAMLCYVANIIPCVVPLGLVYSIIVIVQDKTNKLVRFHAFQSILISAVGFVIGLPCYFVIFALAFMNSTITSLLAGLIGLVMAVFGIALLVFVIISAIKAFKGEIYKIPVIGNFAEQWS